MLETLIFQQLYAQPSIYIQYKSISKLSKAGATLVDTISSIKHSTYRAVWSYSRISTEKLL